MKSEKKKYEEPKYELVNFDKDILTGYYTQSSCWAIVSVETHIDPASGQKYCSLSKDEYYTNTGVIGSSYYPWDP